KQGGARQRQAEAAGFYRTSPPNPLSVRLFASTARVTDGEGEEEGGSHRSLACGVIFRFCVLALRVAPPLGRGLGGGTPANQASIPESQDQQASVSNRKPRVFGGSPEPTPPCRAPLRWRGTLRERLRVIECPFRATSALTHPTLSASFFRNCSKLSGPSSCSV
ncbi:MAG: hypothetical protein UZ07_CHB004001563, partial [Chlorobi bacterium OLB7]